MNASPNPLRSRRNFLGSLAAAGAALPLASIASRAQAAPARAAGKPAPASIHVFSKPLHWMSYDETAALLADCGFDGIDYTVRTAQGHVLPENVERDLPRAIEAARKRGLKVDMITTAIASARDPHAETILRTAAKLGVKYYRTGYLKYDEKLGIWESLQKHKDTLRELAELNERHGIHGAYQNHSGRNVGGPLWDLYELLRDLDPRWIGVQYDIRHATVEGGVAWPLALRLLAPWIKCSDIKDFKWQQEPGKGTIENVPLGEGIVPFDQYFKLVRELNIGGPMSLHLEYAPFERAKISDDEKRRQFPALMKKELATLRGWIAKHQLA